MMGETTTENEVENSEETEAECAERRTSVVTLQNMLRRASHSPFHNQYEVGHVSAATTDLMDKHELHLGQNGLETEDSHLPLAAAQNGVSGPLDRTNPFYSYYLESGSKGHLQDAGRKTSEEASFNPIFLPPPEFQSSPMDTQRDVDVAENHTSHPEPLKDLFPALTHNPIQDIFQVSALPQDESLNRRFRDVTLNSPDLFQPFQPQNLSKTPDQLKEPAQNPFRSAKTEELLRSARADEVNKPLSVFVDPFKSQSEEDDVFQSPQPNVGNPFYNAPTTDADLFQSVSGKNEELFHIRESKPVLSAKEMDIFGTSSNEKLNIFSTSSTNTVDPFPSPITRNLFQDVSGADDPFSDTPLTQSDPFRDVSAADMFQPLPSWTNSNDILKITPDTKATHSASPLSVAAENNPDLQLSSAVDGLLDPLEPGPLGSHSNIQTSETLVTAAQGTKPRILQPTPFSQASGLAVSPCPSPTEMAHVQTFKRPPKPLPRTRPPRIQKPERPPPPEKPPQPAMPIDPEPVVPKPPPKPALPKLPPKPALPKPAFKPLPGIRRRSKPQQEVKPVEPENYVVFEDILLIGQEKCVEDWPEDSPEFSPDFKPPGTLRLRRESLKVKADSDGGSGEDQDGPGSQSKKRDKKFRVSMISRRGSKDKFPDDTKEGKSWTLPVSRKSSKDYLSEVHTSPGENEDGEENGMDHKKNLLKTKVTKLLRRASTNSSVVDGKHMNGHLPQDSKDGDFSKKSKNDSIRRWSEGTVLDDSSGVEEEGGEDNDYTETKKRKKLKIKFVPQRGFTISIKKPHEEPKGAYGNALRKGSKDKTPEEVMGAHGYTPPNKWQDDGFEDIEEMKAHGLQSANKAAFVDDEDLKKTHQSFAGLYDDDDDDEEEMCGMGDCKPKNPKHKPPVPPRKPKTSSNSTAQTDPNRWDQNTLQQTCSEDVFAEDEKNFKGKYSTSHMEMYDVDQDELDICKPKKSSKLKVLKKLKAKRKNVDLEYEDPPGATSSDYMSEAARAEWKAAQRDGRAMDGLEDEDEEGDTDSLMEWWYTVEQWDELLSDDEDVVIKEDESKSFSVLADKVHRGLRVFNKVFTERAEVLWQYIISLHAIADDISTFHQKAKIAGITGGTTTAVGGVAAITGLALAPFTFGASLIVTAVGVGVATAGGITSASAAISDNVNNMHDRKKVEVVLEEYEVHLLDIAKILHFINTGLYKLRGHPFLRSGTQHYSEDWEIRRAVQMISLVDSPVMRATEIVDAALPAVQGLFTGIDKYFLKDSRELKKGCKKEMVGQIKHVATVLNDGIVELNAIREELQDATGDI